MSVLRCCTTLLCSMWIAAMAAPIDTERDRIAAERAAAVAKFAEQERACQAQFIVIACVDAASREQRATLARLLRQQALLDDARRHQAAAARRQTIEARSAAQRARASDADGSTRRDTTRLAPTPHRSGSARAADESRSRAPAQRVPSAEKRSAEQRNEAEFEARARAAQAHREAVQRRNAQRAVQGEMPSPLALPPAASAP